MLLNHIEHSSHRIHIEFKIAVEASDYVFSYVNYVLCGSFNNLKIRSDLIPV